MNRLALVAVVPLLLALAACGPESTPAAQQTSSSTPTAGSSPTPTPTASAAAPIVADDYLLEGGLNADPDGDGFWSAHYGFYFEPSQSARCDIFIFSGDAPVTSCSIIPGKESSANYPLPAGAQCDYSTSNPFDGYSLALGAKGLDPAASGFSGCQDPAAASYFAAETTVLPNGGELTVEPFHCAIAADIATCAYTDGLASISFGLSAVTFTG